MKTTLVKVPYEQQVWLNNFFILYQDHNPYRYELAKLVKCANGFYSDLLDISDDGSLVSYYCIGSGDFETNIEHDLYHITELLLDSNHLEYFELSHNLLVIKQHFETGLKDISFARDIEINGSVDGEYVHYKEFDPQ